MHFRLWNKSIEFTIFCASIIHTHNTSVSKELFVTSKVARFCTNLSFNIIVFQAFLSNTLAINNPEISSMKGASIFMNHCSFGFNIIFSLQKNGIDLFRKLNHDSHEFHLIQRAIKGPNKHTYSQQHTTLVYDIMT